MTTQFVTIFAVLLEGGVFAELNRLAGEGKSTVLTIVGVAVLAFIAMKMIKSGLSMATVAISLVAGGLSLWALNGGLETMSKLISETIGK